MLFPKGTVPNLPQALLMLPPPRMESPSGRLYSAEDSSHVWNTTEASAPRQGLATQQVEFNNWCPGSSWAKHARAWGQGSEAQHCGFFVGGAGD